MDRSEAFEAIPVGEILRPGEDPYRWASQNARRLGPVFRLPLRRPVAVLSGAEALAVFSDPARVIRATAAPAALEAMLANPAGWEAVTPLSLLDGPAHTARSAPVRALLQPAALAEALPALAAEVVAAVERWQAQQLVALGEATAALSWQLMTRLVFGCPPEALDRQDAERVFLHGRGDPAVDASAAQAAHSRLFEGYARLLAEPHPGGVAGRLLDHASPAAVANDAHHMLLAGHNTWMLLVGLLRELEAAPEIQADLRAELGAACEPRALVGLALRPTGALARCVQEGRRLYTLLGWTAGVARAPLTVAGCTLPAGCTLLAAYYATSRDPAVFPEPDAFVPDRWRAPDPAAHAAWCAAGAGPPGVGHRCPAEDLTGALARLFLAAVVSRIRWRAQGEEPLERSARGIRPAHGYRAVLTPLAEAPPRWARSQAAPVRDLPAPEAVRPHDRVAVVGGGLAGLALARALRARGVREVVVFEAAPTVAGKCETWYHEGLPYNLGGHLVCAEKGIQRLAASVGVALEPSYDAQHFSAAQGQIVARPFGFFHDRERYAALKARLPHLTGPTLAGLSEALAAPADRWLAQHDLEALGALLGPFYTGAGYGFLSEDLPAAYFLRFIETQDLGVRASATPAGGYQRLIEALAADLEVRTGARVRRVVRDEAGVTVTTAAGTERFDQLVLAVPPDRAVEFLDACPVERSVFEAVRQQRYVTVVLSASGLPREGLFLVTDHTHDPATRGHITAFAHFHAASDVYVCFAYAEPGDDEATVSARMVADVTAMGGRAGPVHLVRRWDYFPPRGLP